jgi:hypothetical protein
MPFKDPIRQRAAIRESKRKRCAKVLEIARNSGLPEKVNPGGLPDNIPSPLLTAEDARKCLSRLIYNLETDSRIDKVIGARTIGFLIGHFVATIEKSDFEARLVLIEKQLEGNGHGNAEDTA